MVKQTSVYIFIDHAVISTQQCPFLIFFINKMLLHADLLLTRCSLHRPVYAAKCCKVWCIINVYFLLDVIQVVRDHHTSSVKISTARVSFLLFSSSLQYPIWSRNFFGFVPCSCTFAIIVFVTFWYNNFCVLDVRWHEMQCSGSSRFVSLVMCVKQENESISLFVSQQFVLTWLNNMFYSLTSSCVCVCLHLCTVYGPFHNARA